MTFSERNPFSNEFWNRINQIDDVAHAVENADGAHPIALEFSGDALTASIDQSFDQKQVQMYKVKQILNSVLLCVTWDGTVEGATEVPVARPPELRSHLADDANIVAYWKLINTNIATMTTVDTLEVDVTFFSGDDETWRVTPDYAVNTILWAYAPRGGTALEYTGSPVTLLDLNSAGRAYARVQN